MSLKINTIAPDFTLPSTSGKNFTLSSDAKGRPLIIYFYPKDFTGGCTKEACEFRDQFAEFRNLDIDIVGISKDSVETHLKFKKAHNLPFELLADVNGKVTDLYKANIPIINLPKRITYLLDRNHEIVEVFESMFGATKHISHMIEKVKQPV